MLPFGLLRLLTLAPDPGAAAARSGLGGALDEAWEALLADDAGVADRAQALYFRASAERAAAEAIEGIALRAMALASEDVSAALEVARQSSRMAQAEALLESQCLASVVLARLRRLDGRPHLALYILGRAEAAAPTSWRPWMEWERLLAGAEAAVGDEPERGGGAQGLLGGVLRAIRAGDSGGAAAAHAALLRAVARLGPLVAEATAARGLLDPEAGLAEGVGRWAAGEGGGVPLGLFALGSSAVVGEDAAAPVYVVAAPGGRGRRILRAGLGLLRPVVLDVPAGDESAGARVDTGLATLALAGSEGIARDDFFRAVYGFGFVPDRHRGVLEALVRRMRGRLGDTGEIAREGRLSLVLRTVVAVADPRCGLPVPDRLLRALVELGSPGAAEAALALGLPLRTVQTALQQLVTEGAVRVERQGRRVAYRVEDTTFTIATRPQ